MNFNSSFKRKMKQVNEPLPELAHSIQTDTDSFFSLQLLINRVINAKSCVLN